jgi:DNA-binding winged helix-turn-helix (wHTH) protein
VKKTRSFRGTRVLTNDGRIAVDLSGLRLESPIVSPLATSRRAGDPFRVGEWLVEPLRNQIVGPAGPTRIEPRVMRLFTVLAERAPAIVSREELTEEVWQGAFVTDEVLTQSVSELRKALGDDPREPRFIVTMPKRGYQLIVPPTEDAPESRVSGPDAVVDALRLTARARERIAWALLTAVLLLALARLNRSRPSPTIRFAVEAPPATSNETLELSPDGTRLAFIAPDSEEEIRIWIHHLETGGRKPLPGTEGAWHLFWSPDSRYIGFSTVSAVKKVDVTGGFVETVRDNGFLWGGTWNDAGDLLLAHFGQLSMRRAANRIASRRRVRSNPSGRESDRTSFPTESIFSTSPRPHWELVVSTSGPLTRERRGFSWRATPRRSTRTATCCTFEAGRCWRSRSTSKTSGSRVTRAR